MYAVRELWRDAASGVLRLSSPQSWQRTCKRELFRSYLRTTWATTGETTTEHSSRWIRIVFAYYRDLRRLGPQKTLTKRTFDMKKEEESCRGFPHPQGLPGQPSETKQEIRGGEIRYAIRPRKTSNKIRSLICRSPMRTCTRPRLLVNAPVSIRRLLA